MYVLAARFLIDAVITLVLVEVSSFPKKPSSEKALILENCGEKRGILLVAMAMELLLFLFLFCNFSS